MNVFKKVSRLLIVTFLLVSSFSKAAASEEIQLDAIVKSGKIEFNRFFKAEDAIYMISDSQNLTAQIYCHGTFRSTKNLAVLVNLNTTNVFSRESGVFVLNVNKETNQNCKKEVDLLEGQLILGKIVSFDILKGVVL